MFDKYISVPIIPVAVVETEDEIHNIAECALEFLPALELTMRTDYAYTALEILAKHYPTLPRAAATVFSSDQVEKILDLGTNIIISPGHQTSLLNHAQKHKYHYIPGAVTPTEIEQCVAYGHKYIKFFPASVCGGVQWLKAIGAVYSHINVEFMPCGGIQLNNVKEYLVEKNVFACGGSWLCSREILEQKNWKKLRKLFEEAYNLIKEIV